MQWFRMYAEFATDPVVQSMSFDDQRHFVVILCLKCAGTLDRGFSDPQARIGMLRRALGLEALAFDEAKNRLQGSGLIDGDWQPRNWDKRQFQTDHSAAERMRRYRERHRYVTVTSPVTKSDVLDTDTDTDTDTEKKKREKRSRKALPTPLRGSRLPADFELTSERRQIAEAENLDASRTFASFCDHWRAAAGAKARKCDWDATWRNWCRSDFQRGGVGKSGGRKTYADYERESAARLASLPGEDPGPL